jgi:hypothetical protein
MKYHVGLDATLKATAICVIATDAGLCAKAGREQTGSNRRVPERDRSELRDSLVNTHFPPCAFVSH